MCKLVSLGALLLFCGACRGSTGVPPAPDGSLRAEPTTPPPFDSPPVLAGTPDVPALVDKVRPAVVNITVDEFVKVPRFTFELPFDFLPWQHGGTGGAERAPRPDDVLRQRAQGSGFIIDPEGHVVTNAHVVEGASSVRVRLLDGRDFKAHVKGVDRRLDVAVLAMDGAKDLPVVALGSSTELRVGEYVIAIGNPFGLGSTVTMGIVSAKSRALGAGPYDDFIQTDASINPGNSGGPLFNLKGQVVGINTAITARGQGIGFAIPVDSLREALPQLLTTGHVLRGRLGVYIQAMDWPLAKALGLERPEGALVADVEKGGPADRAGIKAGDVIVSVAGARIASAHELPRTVAEHAPGSKLAVELVRDKRKQTVDVTLDALKDEEGDGHGDVTVQPPSHPAHLGIEANDAPGGGALVQRVEPGSPADGLLQPGDVVVRIDHKAVGSARDMEQMLSAAKTTPLLLEVKHDGRTRFVALETK